VKSLRELMDLRGRVAIVTGGAGHLGTAMADGLAELGAALALVDMAQDRCDQAACQLRERHRGQVEAVVADLGDAADVASIPRRVLERFGRIDILVHCAALVGSSSLRGWSVPFVQQSVDTWRLALEVNLTAPFLLSQRCAEALAQSGHGSIIHIASIYGVVGPDNRLYEGTAMASPGAYAASKGGLVQLTRWLATTLAPRVRVNAVSPGGVWRQQPEAFVARYVERTPLGRMATEQDIKGAVAFLASDLSEYVTGQNLLVDGGWTAW
jgi:NAD(P)-dependent dehydrogenase (short-subunit alcohol dehydrogenase family)